MLNIKLERIPSIDKYCQELIVEHNNKEIAREDDCMEPEDALFCRDLSWITTLIEKVYLAGYEDGKTCRI